MATNLVAPKSQLVHRLRHLQGICEDVQLRDWARVRNYHKIFMHRIEQGTATWGGSADLKANLKMRYIYMAQGDVLSKPSVRADGGAKGSKKAASSRRPLSSTQSAVAAASPCDVYNSEKGCQQPGSHDGLKHCCAHCGKVIGRIYNHGTVGCFKLHPLGR